MGLCWLFNKSKKGVNIIGATINKSNAIGLQSINNMGHKMTIVQYRSSRDIDVKFENGEIVRHRLLKDFKRGAIKMPNSPTVFGHGIYDENTNGHYDGNDKCDSKPFVCWQGMIERCYNSALHDKYPTYKNCKCCDDWLYYSKFKKWYKENYYEIPECKYRMELDKDILSRHLLGVDSKIYSPDTTCFVPRDINLLLCKRDRYRGNLPIGITAINKGGYVARLNIDGKRKYLGHFANINEAFNAYKVAKENEIKRKANLYKAYLPSRLYEALIQYEVKITD